MVKHLIQIARLDLEIVRLSSHSSLRSGGLIVAALPHGSPSSTGTGSNASPMITPSCTIQMLTGILDAGVSGLPLAALAALAAWMAANSTLVPWMASRNPIDPKFEVNFS